MTATRKKSAGATLGKCPAMTPSQHRRKWEGETDVPYGHCQCGCGERTTIAPFSWAKHRQVKGCPMRYVLGHNRGRGVRPVVKPEPRHVTTFEGPSMDIVTAILVDEPRPHTMGEVAEIMGVSKQAIEQTERVALRKLRLRCKAIGLHWSDFECAIGMTAPGSLDSGDSIYYSQWVEGHRERDRSGRFKARVKR